MSRRLLGRRWYWRRGRLFRRYWCACAHEDVMHLGLRCRCLEPVAPHPELCSCRAFRQVPA